MSALSQAIRERRGYRGLFPPCPTRYFVFGLSEVSVGYRLGDDRRGIDVGLRLLRRRRTGDLVTYSWYSPSPSFCSSPSSSA